MTKEIRFTDTELLQEYGLKKMIRYNNSNRICDESVAEHSFFVSLFCLKISQRLGLTPLQQRHILIRAILHDVPELAISDVPHNVKEMSVVLSNELAFMERQMIQEHFPEYFELIFEENTLEAMVVDLADAYSVKQFCLNEIELGNNSKKMSTILLHVEQRCNVLIKKIGDKHYA